eukprot:scaffold175_cov414-Prasinococcus_capsulatus_cf.AAC.36
MKSSSPSLTLRSALTAYAGGPDNQNKNLLRELQRLEDLLQLNLAYQTVHSRSDGDPERSSGHMRPCCSTAGVRQPGSSDNSNRCAYSCSKQPKLRAVDTTEPSMYLAQGWASYAELLRHGLIGKLERKSYRIVRVERLGCRDRRVPHYTCTDREWEWDSIAESKNIAFHSAPSVTPALHVPAAYILLGRPRP